MVLIEQRVDDLDPYADLSFFGSDVEGITEFQPGNKPKVKISSALSNDERRVNRFRTTLTHEFGHVHFHAYLWEIEPPGPDLIRQDRTANMQICKRENILEARQSDWMELQAGYVCGSLLMPVSFVRRLLVDTRKKTNYSALLAFAGNMVAH